MGAGAEDAVALDLPMEVVTFFFLRREHGVQMGDQGDASIRPPTPRQDQMIAPILVGGRNKLGSESQRREVFGGEPAQPVHAIWVGGEAVDADHLPQHFQGRGHLTLNKCLQRSDILHWTRVT